MSKLITVARAKEKIKELQHFVELVESYPTDTPERKIIKEYALSNSIIKVTEKLNLDREFVTAVLKKKGGDELHKIMRSGYMSKTKSNRHR